MGHGPLGPLAFWEGYEPELTTLAIYAVGIALYAFFVGTIYLALSHRNLRVMRRAQAKAPGAVRFLFLFPLVSFGMFLVLSVALFFLAKSQLVPDILLLSMAVVGAVRVLAYISEKSAEDLAKILPLGLLGVLLVDPGFLSLQTPFDRIAELIASPALVGRYFLVLVALEGLLRVGWVASGGRKRAEARAKRAAGPTAVLLPQAPAQPPAPAQPAAAAKPAWAPEERR